MGNNDSLLREIATRERSPDFRFAGMVLPNPDQVLRLQGKSIQTYRDMRIDGHVGGCIRRRKSAVKALESGLDDRQAPARVVQSVWDMLRDLPMDRLIGNALDAVLYGYQPMEVTWKTVGRLWAPGDVVAKPPEWFGFDSENRLRFKTREDQVQGELLPDRKFLLPRQDATYDNPYGFADLSMCYWPIVFKKGGMKFWLRFVEKFGGTFMIGKLPRTATKQEHDELLDSLDRLIQDGVGTIPDDGSVAPLESDSKKASADLYERLVMFCRSEVSIALTGTNQTTEADSNLASATAGLTVAESIRDGDASLVAAELNKLIRWIVDLNWGGGPAPLFKFWDQEARDVLQAARDSSNHSAGARFTNAYWRRAYGYQVGDLDEG